MGQAKKKRECPAVGRRISSGECGANRNSVYACPPHCKFNPFAPENYDQMLEMSDEAEEVIMKAAFSDPTFKRKIAAFSRREEVEFEAEMIDLLHATEFRDGMTVLEWVAADPDQVLKNDFKIQIESRKQMRFTLLEIRDVHEEHFTAVDLLRPELGTITIRDDNLSQQVSRFDRVLTYLIKMPLYFRVFGAGSTVPKAGIERDPHETFSILVRHLGWDPAEMDLERWCLKHALQIKAAYSSLAGAYRKAQLEATGDDHDKKAAEAIKVEHPEWVPEVLVKSVEVLSLQSQRFDEPSGPEDQSEQLQRDSMERSYRAFLDRPANALDGKTPREAANDLLLRPILCRIVKDLVHTVDNLNRRGEEPIAIDWIFDELGLEEIRCTAPDRVQATSDYLLPEEEEFDEDALLYWEARYDAAMALEGIDLLSQKLSEADSCGMGALMQEIFRNLEIDPGSTVAKTVKLGCLGIWRTLVQEGEVLQIHPTEIAIEFDFIFNVIDELGKHFSLPALVACCDEPEFLHVSLGAFGEMLEALEPEDPSQIVTNFVVAAFVLINLLAAYADEAS